MIANQKPHFAIPTHDGANFSWKDSRGLAKASALGEHFAKKIWNNSLVAGFNVRGKNATKLFTFSHPVRDREGEVLALVYLSTDRTSEIHVLNT